MEKTSSTSCYLGEGVCREWHLNAHSAVVLTCEGSIGEKGFRKKLEGMVSAMCRMLKIGGDDVSLKMVEPWNSVRVTFTIPRDAAQRLRQLAQGNPQQLRELGILSVQIEGEESAFLSLTWHQPAPVMWSRMPGQSYSHMQQGSMQQGSMQQGSMQQGSMQQGSMQQGSMQQGSMQQGSMQQSSMQQGSMQQSSMQQGSMQQGSMQQSSMQQGSMQQGSMQQGSMQQGSMQQGNMQQSSMQQGSMQQGSMQQGSMQQGSMQQSSMQQGSMQQGSMQQSSMQQGSMQQGSMQQSSMQQGSMQQGSMQQGSMQQGSMQQGSMQQGSMQQGSMQQGSMGMSMQTFQNNAQVPSQFHRPMMTPSTAPPHPPPPYPFGSQQVSAGVQSHFMMAHSSSAPKMSPMLQNKPSGNALPPTSQASLQQGPPPGHMTHYPPVMSSPIQPQRRLEQPGVRNRLPFGMSAVQSNPGGPAPNHEIMAPVPTTSQMENRGHMQSTHYHMAQNAVKFEAHHAAQGAMQASGGEAAGAAPAALGHAQQESQAASRGNKPQDKGPPTPRVQAKAAVTQLEMGSFQPGQVASAGSQREVGTYVRRAAASGGGQQDGRNASWGPLGNQSSSEMNAAGSGQVVASGNQQDAGNALHRQSDAQFDGASQSQVAVSCNPVGAQREEHPPNTMAKTEVQLVTTTKSQMVALQNQVPGAQGQVMNVTSHIRAVTSASESVPEPSADTVEKSSTTGHGNVRKSPCAALTQQLITGVGHGNQTAEFQGRGQGASAGSASEQAEGQEQGGRGPRVRSAGTPGSDACPPGAPLEPALVGERASPTSGGVVVGRFPTPALPYGFSAGAMNPTSAAAAAAAAATRAQAAASLANKDVTLTSPLLVNLLQSDITSSQFAHGNKQGANGANRKKPVRNQKKKNPPGRQDKLNVQRDVADPTREVSEMTEHHLPQKQNVFDSYDPSSATLELATSGPPATSGHDLQPLKPQVAPTILNSVEIPRSLPLYGPSAVYPAGQNAPIGPNNAAVCEKGPQPLGADVAGSSSFSQEKSETIMPSIKEESCAMVENKPNNHFGRDDHSKARHLQTSPTACAGSAASPFSQGQSLPAANIKFGGSTRDLSQLASPGQIGQQGNTSVQILHGGTRIAFSSNTVPSQTPVSGSQHQALSAPLGTLQTSVSRPKTPNRASPRPYNAIPPSFCPPSTEPSEISLSPERLNASIAGLFPPQINVPLPPKQPCLNARTLEQQGLNPTTLKAIGQVPGNQSAFPQMPGGVSVKSEEPYQERQTSIGVKRSSPSSRKGTQCTVKKSIPSPNRKLSVTGTRRAGDSPGAQINKHSLQHSILTSAPDKNASFMNEPLVRNIYLPTLPNFKSSAPAAEPSVTEVTPASIPPMAQMKSPSSLLQPERSEEQSFSAPADGGAVDTHAKPLHVIPPEKRGAADTSSVKNDSGLSSPPSCAQDQMVSEKVDNVDIVCSSDTTNPVSSEPPTSKSSSIPVIEPSNAGERENELNSTNVKEAVVHSAVSKTEQPEQSTAPQDVAVKHESDSNITSCDITSSISSESAKSSAPVESPAAKSSMDVSPERKSAELPEPDDKSYLESQSCHTSANDQQATSDASKVASSSVVSECSSSAESAIGSGIIHDAGAVPCCKKSHHAKTPFESGVGEQLESSEKDEPSAIAPAESQAQLVGPTDNTPVSTDAVTLEDHSSTSTSDDAATQSQSTDVGSSSIQEAAAGESAVDTAGDKGGAPMESELSAKTTVEVDKTSRNKQKEKDSEDPGVQQEMDVLQRKRSTRSASYCVARDVTATGSHAPSKRKKK
ncbi:unnamed protein product [Lampetra planeri]